MNVGLFTCVDDVDTLDKVGRLRTEWESDREDTLGARHGLLHSFLVAQVGGDDFAAKLGEDLGGAGIDIARNDARCEGAIFEESTHDRVSLQARSAEDGGNSRCHLYASLMSAREARHLSAESGGTAALLRCFTLRADQVSRRRSQRLGVHGDI